jgi:homoserine O-acetyltransferase
MLFRLLASTTLLAATLPAATQQFFLLRNFQLASGERIPECRLGFRTFGQLNAARSNAVLFPTWFSGNTERLEPFIGPDKLIDDSRFFVILVDALANGVSCSPSNLNGALSHVTIADMVQAQHRLLTEHFQLNHLHAVIGISMGGMQTFEWMVRFPSFLSRAIPIIGSPRLTTHDLLLWQAQLSILEQAESCSSNLRQAMRAVQLVHQFALYTPQWRAENSPPASFPQLRQQIDQQAATALDPRDWAAQLRAMIHHDIARGAPLDTVAALVQARTLVVVATQDHMVHPAPALDFFSLLARSAHPAASQSQLLQLTGSCGHMATTCEAATLQPRVRDFLAAP